MAGVCRVIFGEKMNRFCRPQGAPARRSQRTGERPRYVECDLAPTAYGLPMERIERYRHFSEQFGASAFPGIGETYSRSGTCTVMCGMSGVPVMRGPSMRYP
jgi:hypothetical protein